jgi:hypothetical protein
MMWQRWGLLAQASERRLPQAKPAPNPFPAAPLASPGYAVFERGHALAARKLEHEVRIVIERQAAGNLTIESWEGSIADNISR